KVSLGVHNSNDLHSSRIYKVDRFLKHWSYVRSSEGSDIGLLKLARKVEFTANIRPICILTDSKIKVDRVSWFLAIGWGKTEPDGDTSNILQTKIIERRDKSECDCLDSQICTVAESGTICYGDSGGPVVLELKIKQKSRYVQLGVSSYVTDHCSKHGVFTDILSHSMWIQFLVGRHTPNDS
ncbi:chymotrypsin-like protease CTRL-1, partial [Drosophila kikkawai]|uniref:Chymotrypsin-like protease CTRL-1 n=1 Tax=Drosophila kikkawai TaxID=30033 RepID=A0ABM4GB46_DROKI